MFVVLKISLLAEIRGKQALLSALAGKKIDVLNATTHALYIEKNIPGADLRIYDTLDQMQMDLTAGRLDAGFSDVLAWNTYLARPENRNFRYVDVAISASDDPATLEKGSALACREGQGYALRECVNRALCALAADGSVRKLSGKWFHDTDVSVPCH